MEKTSVEHFSFCTHEIATGLCYFGDVTKVSNNRLVILGLEGMNAYWLLHQGNVVTCGKRCMGCIAQTHIVEIGSHLQNDMLCCSLSSISVPASRQAVSYQKWTSCLQRNETTFQGISILTISLSKPIDALQKKRGE